MTGRHRLRPEIPHWFKASVVGVFVVITLAATTGVVSIAVSDEMPQPREFVNDGAAVRDSSIDSTEPSSAP